MTQNTNESNCYLKCSVIKRVGNLEIKIPVDGIVKTNDVITEGDDYIIQGIHIPKEDVDILVTLNTGTVTLDLRKLLMPPKKATNKVSGLFDSAVKEQYDELRVTCNIVDRCMGSLIDIDYQKLDDEIDFHRKMLLDRNSSEGIMELVMRIFEPFHNKACEYLEPPLEPMFHPAKI